MAFNVSTSYAGQWLSLTNHRFAVIELRRAKRYLGAFYDINDAIRARREVEERYFHPIVERYNRVQASAQDQKGAVFDERL